MKRVRNPSYPLAPHIKRALDGMAKRRLADLKVQQAFLANARPTAQEKKLIRKITAECLKVDVESHRQAIAKLNEARKDRLIAFKSPTPSSTIVMGGKNDGPEPNDDYFWWIQTSWNSGNGINAEWLSDGLHFFGRAAYEGDQRILFSVGATADFGLDPGRRAISDSGKWRSTPPINLSGQMWGLTGFYNWMLAADDKWLKCFLFLRQTLMQFPSAGSDPIIIGEQISRPELINEENTNRAVQAYLSGSRDMPGTETAVYDPNLDIIAQLEIRFDIELEGYAEISFNSTSTQPSVSNAVVLQTLGWPLIPV
jgi:hypothetical protein